MFLFKGQTQPGFFNVKDYGAAGDGITNDTAAIQRAVDALAPASARGCVFFPPWVYKVTSAIDLNMANSLGSRTVSVVISGCGDASRIVGDVNDYLLKRDPGTYSGYSGNGTFVVENLSVLNDNTGANSGGMILVHNTTMMIRNCRVVGQNGIVLASGEDTINAGNHVFNFTSTVQNCSVTGFGKDTDGGTSTGTGLNLCQGGTSLGNDITGFDVGIRTIGSANEIIGGRVTENATGVLTGQDVTGYEVGGQSGLVIQAVVFEDNDLTIDCVSGGIVNMTIQGLKISSTDGFGVDGISLPSGSGTRITLTSVEVEGDFSGYGIRTPGSGAASFGRTFIGVTSTNTDNSARNWEMPSGAYVAQWINCNNPDPVFTFANLPSGGLVVRNKGDEYMISDSNTQPTSANFGATVAAAGGGTSYLAKVRWNGSNWVIC